MDLPLGQLDTSHYFIIGFSAWIGLTLFFYYRLGKNIHSIEFKVGVMMVSAMMIVALLVTSQTLIFESAWLTYIFVVGIALSIILYFINKTVMNLKNTNDKLNKNVMNLKNTQDQLNKLLTDSSKMSIQVANIATELAASASEVNVASEEISSTTQ
ncbi:MAG: hypothetical protein ACFE9Y_03570, partial [Promethearchaeota archaeon]